VFGWWVDYEELSAMSKEKSPQDKKRLSYARDRRNDYGENSKSSRKNIPRAKAFANRKERHGQNQALRSVAVAETDEQIVRAELAAVTPKRRWWKKLADSPLGAYLANRRFRHK
jgi:hypothetical protein